MICAICGGQVEWRGPLSELTHTQCFDCGAYNCQEVTEGPDEDYLDREPAKEPTT